MEEKRKGRQTPTQAVILDYVDTYGPGAIDLYNSTGRTAQQWQVLMLNHLLAVNEDGLWTHTKFGYSVPRRNGKNEIVVMREMYGLSRGEHILHTAHRTTTTHAAWERLLDLCEKAKLEIESSYRAFGKEHIHLVNGGVIEFRTRTSKGGLGEGFDLLIIDEAQEYQDDQESALKYVVTDSKNPQTIFTGTPPTPVSSGTIFLKYRNSVLAGGVPNAAWAEWSVEKETDPKDVEAWYQANPSLGTILTERSVQDEIGSDAVDFNIQRLGLWLRYNQKSAFSENEWLNLKDRLPTLTGKLYVGIKYGVTGENVALSVAVLTTTGKIFVEAVDCRPIRAGNAWLIDFLRSAKAVKKVIVDGANGQALLAQAMKEARLKPPELPTVKEIIAASSTFEQAVFSASICHAGQPALTQIVSNCEKRAIGTNGGFGYKSIKDGAEIALLDSVILAHWAAHESTKVRAVQKISY